MRLSSAIVESRRYFNHILGATDKSEPILLRRLKVSDFRRHLVERGVDLNDSEVIEWFNHIDSNNDG